MLVFLSFVLIFIFAILGIHIFSGNFIIPPNRFNCDDAGHAFLWTF